MTAMELVRGGLESWTALRPDAAVLFDGDRSMTYREWNDAADRLAHGLAAHGVGRGDVVAVRTCNRMEWAVVCAAIGKLEARLLAVSRRLTPEELGHVLKDARACALIVDDEEPAPLARTAGGRDLLVTARIGGGAAGFAPLESLYKDGPPLVAPANPALIVYTAGTTGRLTGVDMRPRAPLAPERPPYPGADQGASLITTPLHEGAGPDQVWNALAEGRRVVFMRRFDAEDALAMIERRAITHWSGAPAAYRRLAALPDETFERYDVGSLRAISTHGAPCPWPLKTWMIDTFGPILAESYGSTEAGVVTSMPPDMQERKPGSSGPPCPGVEIEIRDAEGAPLAPGKIGNIWVKTPRRFTGYLNAPPPEGDQLDARGFLKMGDVGYLDMDGYLFITDHARDASSPNGKGAAPREK